MPSEVPHSPDEMFVQLFAGHERELRAFIRSMGLDWPAVDDVLQTVSLVMWRKWDQFDPKTSFLNWGRVIARFEVLKYRRQQARDRHLFREDVMELLAEATVELDGQSNAANYRAALLQCLETLPPKSRRLIRIAYSGDQTLRETAAEIGQSATAFYKTLDRIREKLRACIQQRLNAEA